ncbi:hypothetical protein [Ectopseudomonas alcaliphila]|uniref:hypothetical protein n=1 Tax=Ectopseudomonas alcaliphila TaxID=101564 RepID=UPI00278720C0|nr:MULTISPECIES: hypothetical protein [Pseudomonas]MDP9942342.1 hypothetical protein [Pseudomonas sp. 3400]MDR7014280.1 hypothetical protein [Pseudomonas alcaliphila]
MHYWNQRNFKGLKNIAEHLQLKEGYESFSRYCLLREKGLKKNALVELRKFIEEAQSLPIEKQRTIARELTELYFYNSDVHQLLPQPAVAYIGGVLQAWCDISPPQPEPYRWCGVICGNTAFFELALTIDPEDRISLSRLALKELQAVDFATHHLSESIFLGSEPEVDAALAKAASYVIKLPADEEKAKYMREIAYYRTLLNAWQKYKSSSKHKPFPEWSSERGHKFELGSVFYYGSGQT